MRNTRKQDNMSQTNRVGYTSLQELVSMFICLIHIGQSYSILPCTDAMIETFQIVVCSQSCDKSAGS